MYTLVEYIDRQKDGSQHIIQVMGDTARERSDTFHTLSAKELMLQTFAAGDIRINGEHALGAARGIAYEGPAVKDRGGPAISCQVCDFAGPFPVAQDG